MPAEMAQQAGLRGLRAWLASLMQEGGGSAPHKPLEEEPLLAARMVIEDGLCLLLDVDDIDRLWAAQRARPSGPASPAAALTTPIRQHHSAWAGCA